MRVANLMIHKYKINNLMLIKFITLIISKYKLIHKNNRLNTIR